MKENIKAGYNKKKFYCKFIKLYCKLFLFLIILSFLLYYLISKNKYKFCTNCIKNINISSICYKCPNEFLFQGLKIISPENTIKEIIKYNKSISRFGDGEFNLIFKNGIRFQEFNQRLSKKLMEVLNSNKKNLLVGILYYPYKKSQQSLYIKEVVRFFEIWFLKNKFKLLKILDKKKKYYSTEITRFYFHLKNKSKVPQYIKKLKKIWNERDVLFVEGEKTRLGIGNDLFNNTKSIKRIICPAKNSFRVYDKILNSILKFDKNILILISLGPTATVLAYDLTLSGYQAIDIGHVDIEYELFLRKAKKMIQIPLKYVNEYNSGRNENVGKVTDVNYYKQIVYKID